MHLYKAQFDINSISTFNSCWELLRKVLINKYRAKSCIFDEYNFTVSHSNQKYIQANTRYFKWGSFVLNKLIRIAQVDNFEMQPGLKHVSVYQWLLELWNASKFVFQREIVNPSKKICKNFDERYWAIFNTSFQFIIMENAYEFR